MTYATSLHSEKSEVSSKSARSYFSFSSVPSLKKSLWKSVKTWMMMRPQSSPPTSSMASTLARDSDSITTTLTSSSSSLKRSVTAAASAAAGEPLPLVASTCLKPTKGILVKARRRQRIERVTFREPSPVPRFRNVPPPPPPSPPYLEIVVRPDRPQQGSAVIDDTTVFIQKEKTTNVASSNTSLFSEDMVFSRRLSFASPWHRGQTLFFTLFNALPEDHLIVYKFLTSNAKLASSAASINSKRSSISSVMTSSSGINNSTQSGSQERYFIRPSAGKTTDHTEVMLFLNQVPDEPPRSNGKVFFKDKIIVRWAVVQRNTQVEAWVLALPESMRRRWLEMLVERWADQVVVRETRLKIRFL